MIKNKIYILLIVAFIFSQDQIGEGMHSENLILFLQQNYTTNTVLSYDNARDILYSEVDKESNDLVYCIYTNYSVQLDPQADPSTFLYNNGMDCEHIWPQSLYEGSSPMKADMHHLRPCKSNVNSSRGNKPFNEIQDSNANHWYWLNYDLSSPPSNNINEYSESSSNAFEPREDKKGDIARTIFYFYTIYKNVANDNFFESQKDILYQWHMQDQITEQEIQRTWDIASYQNNIPNPFILDNSLIYRSYFYTSQPGDVNIDNIVNVVDIVFMVSIIMDNTETSSEQFANADLDGNLLINVADIVALVNIIIS
tara:strand:+ start:669 stop:1601 length:933 start_codon:yes stop_codon:yes gene_type:complete